ncbi:MAG: type I methionyl aminopeptidase [Candidatus Pacebacteria bacterium]|jgi:methionyl aminopeptidase|nr:type I methionyl aminopeptidase [Candidatus Paceibacterota bacterium]
MATIIKTKKEIDILREGGKRLSAILHTVALKALPGVSEKELDQYAEELVRKGGDEPAFLHYQPDGADSPFPASLCVSVNNEVVHGIPTKDRVLKDGDIVSIDLGLKHKGMFTDMAITVPVGKVTKTDRELLKATKDALLTGIAEALPGKRTGDIGHAIEKFVGKRYGIVRILSGHGVGRAIHEDPYIPNFGKKGTGEVLRPGMVVAIEPMLNLGTHDVVLDRDQWTIKTADGKRSAHFEHTVLITENGPEILTEHE